jgi:ABC-type antimicrobial peptide transport system permease subunit
MIGGTCYLRMKPERFTSVIEHIKEVYKSHNLNYPLDFRFVEDDYNNLYRTEQRMSKIFGYFSFLAIIISCLGLIGLSTFMTERRTKEIGIRKANGAKSIEIFSLLSKEYIILVIISFLIASPIAWYFMNKWLQNFAYRINIGWWVFALTGVIVMLITMLTVGFQSYRAASKNPVEALRYE